MRSATGGTRPGEHAVYPGTFDPVTPGHLDIIERARHLFARVTVLAAVNAGKQPAGTPLERAARLRRELPADRDNVSVAAWAGLTAAFCRQHGAGVIIRGARNGADLRHEYQLAVMNEAMGITTLLLPAKPELAAVSSTLMRGPAGDAPGRLPGARAFGGPARARPHRQARAGRRELAALIRAARRVSGEPERSALSVFPRARHRPRRALRGRCRARSPSGVPARGSTCPGDSAGAAGYGGGMGCMGCFAVTAA